MASIEKYQEFLSDIKASSEISEENKKILLDVLETNEMQANIPNESLHDLAESLKASGANNKLTPSSIISEVTVIQNRALKDQLSRMSNRSTVDMKDAALASAAAFTLADIVANAKKYGISEDAARNILEMESSIDTVSIYGSDDTHKKQYEANITLLYGEKAVEYESTIDQTINPSNSKTINKDESINRLANLIAGFGGPLANPNLLYGDISKLAQMINQYKSSYTPEQLAQIRQIADTITMINSIDGEEFTEEELNNTRKKVYDEAAKEKLEKIAVRTAGGDTSKVGKSMLSDSIDIDNKEETKNNLNGFASKYEKISNTEKDPRAAKSAKKVAEEVARLAKKIKILQQKQVVTQEVVPDEVIDDFKELRGEELPAGKTNTVSKEDTLKNVPKQIKEINGAAEKDFKETGENLPDEDFDLSSFAFLDESAVEVVEEQIGEDDSIKHEADSGKEARALGETETKEKDVEEITQNQKQTQPTYNWRDVLKRFINRITGKTKALAAPQHEKAHEEETQEQPKPDEVKKNDDSFFGRLAKALGIKKEEPPRVDIPLSTEERNVIESSIFKHVKTNPAEAVKKAEENNVKKIEEKTNEGR